MTQTENLKLNCWTADDPIQVSQLSENFEKLDQSANVAKLLEVEDTVGGTNQIDLDLSGINLEDWRWLEIDFCITGNTSSPTGIVRLNDVSNAKSYFSAAYDNTNTTSTTNSLVSFDTLSGDTATALLCRLRLFCLNNTILCTLDEHKQTPTLCAWKKYFGGIKNSSLTADALTSLSFSITYGTFEPGSKFTVYGVKA